ncbi:MAG TPA: OsmC family protein [Dietzia timorensis]|uniref:OsmC family protein n=1 Tax=Dietzia timorensis TaxID=499555 RepID=A0A921JY80_9ACTN|nr:OsmC family protein [Dietzia timorensis]HJE90919.1 OsmC family protein [Dietzia timorensis]
MTSSDVSQPAAAELWVERTGSARFTGKSSRGAEVRVGRDTVEGAFTPGELLKIALAACTAMSADGPLERRLGEDFSGTVRVSGAADREQERYPHLDEVFELDLAEFSDADREKIRTIATRAIDRACTVGRTLKAGTEIDLSFDDSGAEA